MQLVPTFFLLVSTIVHLIYVIAAPNPDLEAMKARREVALSRFYESKQYAPVRLPSRRRNDLSALLLNYVKFVRTVSQRYFTSTRRGMETRFSRVCEGFLHSIVLARDRAMGLPSDALGHSDQGESNLALEIETKVNETAAFKGFAATEGGDKNLRTKPVYRAIASALHRFKQTAQEFVSWIQDKTPNAIPESIVQSLTEKGFQDEVMSPQVFEEDLTAEPSIEHVPEASPEPLLQKGFRPTPQVYVTEVSTPEASASPLLN